MKIRSTTLNKSAALLAASLIQRWMGTLDYRAQFYDPTVDPTHPAATGQKIFLFWHEYILFPLSIRGHNNLAMLLSRHNDAEILSHVARYLGFDFVRGSSNRGGAAALRTLLRKSANMHLTITPDGPRGPRRVLSQGPIYLSSKLGLPLVLMGFGYGACWRARSWDRFAVPKPYTRARVCVSPAIQIPPNLDRDGIEHYRQTMSQLLNHLTNEAEGWAAGGERRQGEVIIRRQPAPLPGQRYLQTADSAAQMILLPHEGPPAMASSKAA